MAWSLRGVGATPPTPEVPQREARRALHVRHKPPGGGDEHINTLRGCEPHLPSRCCTRQQQAAEQAGIQRPSAGVPQQAQRADRGEQARGGGRVGVASGGEGGGLDGQRPLGRGEAQGQAGGGAQGLEDGVNLGGRGGKGWVRSVHAATRQRGWKEAEGMDREGETKRRRVPVPRGLSLGGPPVPSGSAGSRLPGRPCAAWKQSTGQPLIVCMSAGPKIAPGSGASRLLMNRKYALRDTVTMLVGDGRKRAQEHPPGRRA